MWAFSVAVRGIISSITGIAISWASPVAIYLQFIIFPVLSEKWYIYMPICIIILTMTFPLICFPALSRDDVILLKSRRSRKELGETKESIAEGVIESGSSDVPESL